MDFNSKGSGELKQKHTKKATLPYCLHEGKSYLKGETWQTDACQICSCNGDVALCKKIQCPVISSKFFLYQLNFKIYFLDSCNWVGVPDGECCPVCLGCKDDYGRHKQVGEFWIQDDCTKFVKLNASVWDLDGKKDIKNILITLFKLKNIRLKLSRTGTTNTERL